MLISYPTNFMQAVILSAGKGTRLNPLTKSVPKVMVPIKGKPLLEWHIEHLKKFGIKDIFINLHYLPNFITDYFGNGEKFGVNILYKYEKNLLGTGGGVAQFKNKLRGTFFLLYGDIFTNINIKKMYKFHKAKKAKVTMVVSKTDHPADSDLVSFFPDCSLDNLFLKPHEKLPETPFSLSAVYMIEPEVLPDSVKGPFELERDFLTDLHKKRGSIFCYETSEIVKDIGTPQRYELVRKSYGIGR